MLAGQAPDSERMLVPSLCVLLDGVMTVGACRRNLAETSPSPWLKYFLALPPNDFD
jgi:hypothetical protein